MGGRRNKTKKGRRNSGGKEVKKKSLLLDLNWSVQFCWSSCHLIFQCPLSFVSDLQICWSTVGCSLCSSDQLGISLVLRGSGLHSHLSRPHLLIRWVLSFSRYTDVRSFYLFLYVISGRGSAKWIKTVGETILWGLKYQQVEKIWEIIWISIALTVIFHPTIHFFL